LARVKARASIREGLFVGLLRALKHSLLAELFLPNLVALFFRAKRRIDSTSSRVTIMASSPPFSLAVVGALLKRARPCQVTFAVDMRDAWALHTSLRGFSSLKRKIERWVLHTCDRVTTVSHGL